MQLYRLFYYSSRRAPIVTTLVKKVKFNEIHYSSEEKFLIGSRQLELVNTFIQSGKSIERMQKEAKKLCNLLSLIYGFRINELVLDFIRDENDIYWLINIPYFTLEQSNYNIKKLEHQKLIQNQAITLELLRQQASDSSNFL